jgi:glycosyltransferase involved in cell wall biosynthesis
MGRGPAVRLPPERGPDGFAGRLGGVVLIEAAAAGRPAIATDVGGVSEGVVAADSGIQVPPNDEEAPASAHASLASDSEHRQRMGQHAREHVVGRYPRSG